MSELSIPYLYTRSRAVVSCLTPPSSLGFPLDNYEHSRDKSLFSHLTPIKIGVKQKGRDRRDTRSAAPRPLRKKMRPRDAFLKFVYICRSFVWAHFGIP